MKLLPIALLALLPAWPFAPAPSANDEEIQLVRATLDDWFTKQEWAKTPKESEVWIIWAACPASVSFRQSGISVTVLPSATDGERGRWKARGAVVDLCGVSIEGERATVHFGVSYPGEEYERGVAYSYVRESDCWKWAGTGCAS